MGSKPSPFALTDSESVTNTHSRHRIKIIKIEVKDSNVKRIRPKLQAIAKGLRVPRYVKTSLSPGSGVVTKYLQASGLLKDLEKLGYFIAGYGCMTCIGNSGPLHESVARAIEQVSFNLQLKKKTGFVS